MTNTKSTKRALLVSVMAMVICFTMLLGTTFAWFTSEDKVTDNVITAGKLEVKLTGATISLEDMEPGYVHVETYTVSNEGTLDFNYKLRLVKDQTSAEFDLAKVIDVYYYSGKTAPTVNRSLDGFTKIGTLADVTKTTVDFAAGDLNAEENDDVIVIAFKMQETAGNDYQELTLNNKFTVQVLAAQKASDTDSIGSDYDNDATYQDGTASN